MCCDKVKFDTEKQARKLLRRKRAEQRRESRVYLCPDCHAFHLTSTEDTFVKRGKKNRMKARRQGMFYDEGVDTDDYL